MSKFNKLKIQFLKQNSENEFKYKARSLDYLLSTEKDENANKNTLQRGT